MNRELPIRPQDFGELAAALVLDEHKAKFGVTEVKLQGKNSPFDVNFYQEENLVGYCQVKTSIDERHEAREAEFRKNISQITPLPAGMGVWTVEIPEEIKLKKTFPQIQNFLAELEKKNIARWQPWMAVKDSSSDISEIGVRLGITSAVKLNNSEGDYFYLPSRVTFGVINEGPVGVSDWITNLIKKHSNSLNGLKDSKAEHKHLFFWIGSSTPDDISLSANFYPTMLPSEKLSIPDWVTEVWIGIPFLGDTETLYIWNYSHLGWRLRQVHNWPTKIVKYT